MPNFARYLRSPATLLFATGYGTRVAVLSLITSWTDEDTRASTFGIAQIVEGIGRMCGDPILLRIFAKSMRMEGLLQGLPFYVAAVSFLRANNQLVLCTVLTTIKRSVSAWLL